MFKEHWKNNKGFFILFFLNILLAVGDFTATAINGRLVEILELNPLEDLTGKAFYFVIFVIHVILFYGLYHFYLRKKAHIDTRFSIISMLTLLAFVRVYVIRNGILMWKYSRQYVVDTGGVLGQATYDPAYVQNLEAFVTPEYKLAQQLMLLGVVALPFVYNYLSYYFWRLDHDVGRKDV